MFALQNMESAKNDFVVFVRPGHCGVEKESTRQVIFLDGRSNLFRRRMLVSIEYRTPWNHHYLLFRYSVLTKGNGRSPASGGVAVAV
jgi:hypothetical protein